MTVRQLSCIVSTYCERARPDCSWNANLLAVWFECKLNRFVVCLHSNSSLPSQATFSKQYAWQTSQHILTESRRKQDNRYNLCSISYGSILYRENCYRGSSGKDCCSLPVYILCMTIFQSCLMGRTYSWGNWIAHRVTTLMPATCMLLFVLLYITGEA